MNTKLNSMNSINLNSHATNKLIMLKQYFFFFPMQFRGKKYYDKKYIFPSLYNTRS